MNAPTWQPPLLPHQPQDLSTTHLSSPLLGGNEDQQQPLGRTQEQFGGRLHTEVEYSSSRMALMTLIGSFQVQTMKSWQNSSMTSPVSLLQPPLTLKLKSQVIMRQQHLLLPMKRHTGTWQTLLKSPQATQFHHLPRHQTASPTLPQRRPTPPNSPSTSGLSSLHSLLVDALIMLLQESPL